MKFEQLPMKTSAAMEMESTAAEMERCSFFTLNFIQI